MKITMLSSYNFISYNFLYPLLVLRKRLNTSGYKINFFTKIKPALFKADILLIDSRYFTSFWSSKAQEAYKLLGILRKKMSRIIWLDVTDSTGTTQFQVLPFVDRYLKKQLLKDKLLYKNTFYNGRIYADYYKSKFSLRDGECDTFMPLKEEYLPKLGVSWNLSLGPFHYNNKINNIMRMIPYSVKKHMRFKYGFKFNSDTNATNDICFRGSHAYRNLSTAFQRLEIEKRLAKRGVSTSPLSYKNYVRELLSCRICISPFGSGEICFRDFETMRAGRLLFKPDMSHLETWPDLFVDNQTYVSFNWDFSDFEGKIDDLLKHPDIMLRISGSAQEKYKYLFSREGQEDFCNRFIEITR